MPVHVPGLVRGAHAVLLVTDLSRDSLLEELEAVLAAFEMRRLHFAPRKEAGERDSVLCRVLANKMDAPEAPLRLALLREAIGQRLETLPISATRRDSVAAVPEALFHWLGIVRVYTKAPGEKPDLGRPYTLFSGQTVQDLCALVHKDFASNLRYARLWRGSSDPVTVSRHEAVQDRDVVELHL